MSMRDFDNRVYRSFEEFEREELRRYEAMGSGVGDLFDETFGGELDFDDDDVKRSARRDQDEDEE